MLGFSSFSKKNFSIIDAFSFCLGIFFVVYINIRHVAGADFTLLPGDRYDAVIVTTILEHWLNVFRGQAEWMEVGYFFPYKSTLANTDAYFILGLIYSPFRLAGFDPYLSAYFSAILMRIIGFVGMYMLCLRSKFPPRYALLAGVIFSIGNGLTAHDQRLQLSTISLAPFAILLLCRIYEGLKEQCRKDVLFYGVIFSCLYGAWCMTCFYTAWFFGFYLLVGGVVFGIISLVKCRDELSGLCLSSEFLIMAASLAIIFIIPLIPFMYLYLPKSLEVGVRPLETVLLNTIPISGILQVGSDNFFLGGFYNNFLTWLGVQDRGVGEYYNFGFTIPLFCIFIVAAIKRFGRPVSTLNDAMLLSGVIAVFVLAVLALRFEGSSLWGAVYYSVPGAKALAVVSAILLFLFFPVVYFSVEFLSKIKLPGFLALFVAIVLIVAELNASVPRLDRRSEIERLSDFQSPPSECSSFYVSAWPNQSHDGNFDPWVNDFYAHNVSAMKLAQMFGLPTLNGIASFNPPDWVFAATTNASEYEHNIACYIARHDLSGVCKLDLGSKKWSRNDMDKFDCPTLKDEIRFSNNGSLGVITKLEGFSYPEDWGRWSEGKLVKLNFASQLPANFTMQLTAHASGKNVNAPIIFSVGEFKAEFFLSEFDKVIEIEVVNSSRSSVMEFNIPNPASPSSLGAGLDVRELGVGFVSIKLQ